MTDILIPLTRGLVTVIDATDWPLVGTVRWLATGTAPHYYAAHYWTVQRDVTYLHRFLVRPQPGDIVDHINGDTLDNRRHNLRTATYQDNAINRQARLSPHGFKGVWQEIGGRHLKQWRASIHDQGHRIHLGRFESALQAAMAYDEAAKTLHGAKARLNFP